MKKKGLAKGIAALLVAVFGYGALEAVDVIGDFFADGKSVETIREFTTAEGEMQVTFLDVGQGDCTIVRTDGHAMVIDTGDNGEGEYVVDYLQEEGIDVLDYLILTHPDADHIGGGDNVLESIEVKEILMPDVTNDTVTYEEVAEDIDQFSIHTTNPQPGDVYELGDAEFTILCPEAEAVDDSDLNGASVGIKLIHGENAFVMCGDAEEEAEQNMVDHFGTGLECDVLKCGHHGSSTATSDAFLKATDPTWAVISCGQDNRYGHPHEEVLAKLKEEDVQVYRTDRLGTITAVSDGKNISWSSER